VLLLAPDCRPGLAWSGGAAIVEGTLAPLNTKTSTNTMNEASDRLPMTMPLQKARHPAAEPNSSQRARLVLQRRAADTELPSSGARLVDVVRPDLNEAEPRGRTRHPHKSQLGQSVSREAHTACPTPTATDRRARRVCRYQAAHIAVRIRPASGVVNDRSFRGPARRARPLRSADLGPDSRTRRMVRHRRFRNDLNLMTPWVAPAGPTLAAGSRRLRASDRGRS
jgi:hypothetical protein